MSGKNSTFPKIDINYLIFFTAFAFENLKSSAELLW